MLSDKCLNEMRRQKYVIDSTLAVVCLDVPTASWFIAEFCRSKKGKKKKRKHWPITTLPEHRTAETNMWRPILSCNDPMLSGHPATAVCHEWVKSWNSNLGVRVAGGTEGVSQMPLLYQSVETVTQDLWHSLWHSWVHPLYARHSSPLLYYNKFQKFS